MLLVGFRQFGRFNNQTALHVPHAPPRLANRTGRPGIRTGVGVVPGQTGFATTTTLLRYDVPFQSSHVTRTSRPPTDWSKTRAESFANVALR